MSDSTTTVHKGYRFKLKPTPQQAEQFRQHCGSVRWIYNYMLAARRDAFKAGEKTPSTNRQIKQLPTLKQQTEMAWLQNVDSQVLQDAVLNLDDAFSRFFKKQSRYPQFKRKHGKRESFTYPQGKRIKVEQNRVYLPKIGWVHFHQSRIIDGEIKRVTIKQKARGWFISFTVELIIPTPAIQHPTNENSIGIDLGSIDLVTTSHGEKITNPRHYRKLERKLKRQQRALSRKKMGSNNYIKQKRRVARLHEQIANRRIDNLHKISHKLIDENQAVFCEDLNVLGIAKTLGKSVCDAGWGELLHQLKYKSAWAGKTFYQVGRYYPSSKMCSVCGHKHDELARSDRIWTCPSCRMSHDRDINAAINIHREGLKHFAAGQTEK